MWPRKTDHIFKDRMKKINVTCNWAFVRVLWVQPPVRSFIYLAPKGDNGLFSSLQNKRTILHAEVVQASQQRIENMQGQHNTGFNFSYKNIRGLI